MTKQEFIEEIATAVKKYAPKYGIKVYSPIIAQAILESATGTSELAINANNFFGIKYRKNRCPSCNGIYYKVGSEQNADGSYTNSNIQWCKFPNLDLGVKSYFEFINISRYANLKGITEPQKYLETIKADGYATSLKYVENLMNVINTYNLTKYDEGDDSMFINKNYPCNSKNYGKTRDTKNIKFIVIHYTANKTDKAVNNCKYFQTAGRNASAHYFVDNDGVWQSVEDNIVAWSVGGSRYTNYKTTGGAKFYGICTNSNSISIELCSTNGIITDKTQDNAIELVKILMKKYNIPISNVIRHFDVTGKKCPGWNGWCNNNSEKWNAFLAKLGVKTTNTTETVNNVNYLIQVTANVLNIREGVGTDYKIVGQLKKSNTKYTIIEEKDGWGKLKSGAGWISLKYTKKV